MPDLLGLREQMRDGFRELLGWESDGELGVVDFTLACYLSAFHQGENEPAWGEILGPPSSGKGETLRAVQSYSGLGGSVVVMNITSKALSSQYKDEADPDRSNALLHALERKTDPKGPKVLIFPDFTSIMSSDPTIVNKLFGDFRASYDEDFYGASGNVGTYVFHSKGFGFLLACTEVLDHFSQKAQVLGERFLSYRVGRGMSAFEARRKIARRMGHIDRQAKGRLRRTIRLAAHDIIQEAGSLLYKGDAPISCPDEYSLLRADIATLTTSIRAQPAKDRMVEGAEGPSRFQQQLQSLGDAHAALMGQNQWGDSQIDLIRRVSQDTILPLSLRVICTLYRQDPALAIEPMPIRDIAMLSRVSMDGLSRQLEQWRRFGVVREFGRTGNYTNWGLTPSVVSTIVETDFLRGV